MGLWSAGNNYLDRTAPWTALKTDRERAAGALRTAVNLVRIFSVLAWPVIPASCEKVFRSLRLVPSEQGWIAGNLLAEMQALKPGRPFDMSEPLFRKIVDAEIAEWTERFGGRSATEA